ncbi:hypothetical protein D9M70_318200 [compost metagenome]
MPSIGSVTRFDQPGMPLAAPLRSSSRSLRESSPSSMPMSSSLKPLSSTAASSQRPARTAARKRAIRSSRLEVRSSSRRMPPWPGTAMAGAAPCATRAASCSGALSGKATSPWLGRPPPPRCWPTWLSSCASSRSPAVEPGANWRSPKATWRPAVKARARRASAIAAASGPVCSRACLAGSRTAAGRRSRSPASSLRAGRAASLPSMAATSWPVLLPVPLPAPGR